MDALIARCQNLDGLLELLFPGFACFDFHAGSVAGLVGHWLTNQKIFVLEHAGYQSAGVEIGSRPLHIVVIPPQ